MDPRLHYDKPIFDAHTHILGEPLLDLFVKIADSYGIVKTLAILHDDDDLKMTEEKYPGRFIFAKYFSGSMLLTTNEKQVVREVNILRDQGYSIAKSHFAPFWIHRISDIPEDRKMNSDKFDAFFNTLSDLDIRLLVHVSDPDTYYASRYTDTHLYGTKDEHIEQFDLRLGKSSDLTFLAAHFAAQPEAPRLDNLDAMLKKHKNLYLDTSSARWMSRELGKAPVKAREFFIRHADRILFATDCLNRTEDPNYYDGRHKALRLMFETDIKMEPLPFDDPDTAQSGGTFINGINLPENVLDKIYWKNALSFFDE